VGRFGAASVLSFYATKLITTGEGGMILTRDRSLQERVRDRRDYDERHRHATRYNYKLTDLQAALGRSQLRRFPAALARRAAIARRYLRAWASLSIRLPEPDERSTHAHYRFVIAVPGRAAAAARQLLPLGVTARPPVFQPIHRTLGLPGFPGTEEAWRHALSLPLYPGLTASEQAQVIQAVRRIFP
jgi:dTDP-4-amino-4,6-dideoxygalactose transaminase